MPSNAEMLAGVPLFALLDDQERATLADRVDVVKFTKGESIFRVGDPGDAMFVVRSGAVHVSIKNDTGDTIVLDNAGPGDYFGETSLLDNGPRNADAMALEEVEALVVDRGDLEELIHLKPASALDLLGAFGRRLRENARLLRHSASRNVNKEEEDHRSKVMKVADWISDFSGSLSFLFIHLGIFFVWIVLNIKPLVHTSIGGFDPFPFGLLTMAVSLEAIVLSVFVLLSQNRQVARERVRNDIEFEVNVKAELQISHMHKKIDDIHAELLLRLDRLEKGPRNTAVPSPPQG